MKITTLILSVVICLTWFSCNHDPALPQPSLTNDTTGIEIPSVVDSPKVIPPNPADSIVAIYKGTTRRYYGYGVSGSPPQIFDTTYADELVIYMDSTDKYNTFHLKLPSPTQTEFDLYDTLQLTYKKSNDYLIYSTSHSSATLKFYMMNDSLVYRSWFGTQGASGETLFTGKR